MSLVNLIPELFKSIDNQDMDSFIGYLDKDVVFRFGNMPEVKGKENVRASVQGFYDSIKALSHQVNEILDKDDKLVCSGTVTYTRQDSSKLTVPFANIFKIDDGSIKEYLIYADISELYK